MELSSKTFGRERIPYSQDQFQERYVSVVDVDINVGMRVRHKRLNLKTGPSRENRQVDDETTYFLHNALQSVITEIRFRCRSRGSRFDPQPELTMLCSFRKLIHCNGINGVLSNILVWFKTAESCKLWSIWALCTTEYCFQILGKSGTVYLRKEFEHTKILRASPSDVLGKKRYPPGTQSKFIQFQDNHPCGRAPCLSELRLRVKYCCATVRLGQSPR